MIVNVKLEDLNGNLIWKREWEDYKSFYQMAKDKWVNIPISCWTGICWVCKCKIKTWQEYVQIDKISSPLRELAQDENWNFTEVLSCIGWIKSDYIKDEKNYEIILQKEI